MSTSSQTSLSVSDLPFLDITAPGFTWEDPAVVEAREQCWAAHTPLGPLTLRYAETAELLNDSRLGLPYRYLAEQTGFTSGPVYDFVTSWILSRNGTEHQRLRKPVTAALTTRKIAGLRPFIRATAQQLADRLTTAGVCDVMETFVDPFLVAIMCRLLGIPAGDGDLVHRWGKQSLLLFSGDPDQMPRAREAIQGLLGYVPSMISRLRADPDTDTVSSGFIRAQQNGALSEEELHNLAIALIMGAQDNPHHQLGSALVAFAEHPGQWRQLRRRPELTERAVEEILRWCPVLPIQTREVAVDFDYQGLRIPAGTAIQLGVHPANRDPRAFTDGDGFDITMERKTPPLGFGGGPYYCPGAGLVRTGLAEALTALTTRLGPPQVTGPITWRPTISNTGPETLPLRFG